MLPPNLKRFVATLLGAVLAVGRRIARLPAALLVEMRCARRIDAAARRVNAMRTKIGIMSGHLHAGSIEGRVDADRNLRRMLGELKDDLSEMRRDLAQWHVKECRGRTGARLEAAIAQLNRIAADTWAAADRLVLQIEEYDGARAHCPG
ncbi:hypothetical protein QPK31_19335 [Massilia sp. YIM B02769]|uniref:hypothetical protein n=1 Tax=unclassified Massilia TaxID=2609279 RepID=UPI0025B67DE8|nr:MULTISPECIES: hypothetical protein [unclassified Massilia]MDN4060366.1 hypothetical protein [Massilia sp. YIM B02769]